MTILWYTNVQLYITTGIIKYLTRPPDSSAWGIKTVMVFADALEDICCKLAVWGSYPGAMVNKLIIHAH